MSVVSPVCQSGFWTASHASRNFGVLPAAFRRERDGSVPVLSLRSSTGGPPAARLLTPNIHEGHFKSRKCHIRF